MGKLYAASGELENEERGGRGRHFWEEYFFPKDAFAMHCARTGEAGEIYLYFLVSLVSFLLLSLPVGNLDVTVFGKYNLILSYWLGSWTWCS